MGTLFLVATPIGNFQDISLRQAEILYNADLIACEDTRRTGMLLKFIHDTFFAHEPIRKVPLLSYYEQNEQFRIPQILNAFQNNVHVCLVSDAGVPLVSDPGYKLVRTVIAQGIRVEAIPGPSAVLTALVVSGLPTDKFMFVGYPPHKPGHRQKLFENIQKSQEIIKSTVILYEAPHKLKQTLQEMHAVLGDITIVIARELTKVHEEVLRGTISEMITHFEKTIPKGECTLLLYFGN